MTDGPEGAGRPESRLFVKYVALFGTLLCTVLLINGAVGMWLSYRDHRDSLIRLQREQANAAAEKISGFVSEIEGHLGWLTQLPWSAGSLEERRDDALRLLRQMPAVTEVTLLDDKAREQLVVSRIAMNAVGSGIDHSDHPAVAARLPYYGPVRFRAQSEPYLSLAVGGPHRDAGLAIAEVNLVHVWDVISRIQLGAGGSAYVVDSTGRLIAHPEIGRVLRNTDLSGFAQIKGARTGASVDTAQDIEGRPVISAHAAIAPLGWLVFVETPVAVALAPVYASLLATGLVLAGGLVLAIVVSLMIARRIARPIQLLSRGAARIGAGKLGERLDIRTGDELEALGRQFNRMAEQLQSSYTTLEFKVQERTRQLTLANLAKSRFLAAASHDLRQPLHALNLFVGRLRASTDPLERARLEGRIEVAIAAMNDLFNALLDISRLDAGVMTPTWADFPIQRLLDRLDATFAASAREKGLRFRIVASDAFVRSDPVLLEQIMLNLLSNATRYTGRGGILVGCRRRGDRLRIEVYDTGIGISDAERPKIFHEFYQAAGPTRERRVGLGLGLAIVERLCNLLGHPLQLASIPGKGSRFSVLIPLAPARALRAQAEPAPMYEDPLQGMTVLIIDDDPLVLDGMTGLLQTWGCDVLAARSESEALGQLVRSARVPDIIVSDYHLEGMSTGIDAIAKLHAAAGMTIPSLLISGDTDPERLVEARTHGYHMLHKPVHPVTLRAVLTGLLKQSGASAARVTRSARLPGAELTAEK